MTENILNGKYNGGVMTFGYIIDDERHFQIDHGRAVIVTEIFKKYAGGESIKDIVSGLKSQGIKML